MPDATFPAALVAVKNALHQSDGWRWLAAIDVDGTEGYFLTDGDAEITYGGKTYTPYPFRVDEIRSDSDGSLPDVGLVFASADDIIAQHLDAGDVLGRAIQLYRVNLANESLAIDAGLWTAIDASLDANTATLLVGPFPLFDSPFPAVRQLRGRCPKVYGGTDCQYNTALPNLISASRPDFDTASCDYGLDSGNGCRAHGENEAANGAAVKHPLRFGGFPGIPKGKRL